MGNLLEWVAPNKPLTINATWVQNSPSSNKELFRLQLRRANVKCSTVATSGAYVCQAHVWLILFYVDIPTSSISWRVQGK